jgi:predicted RNA-binding Zn ribbon-like protein
MSKASRRFQVRGELANLYDFANTLDLRCFTHYGEQHQTGDEIRTPQELDAWMAERGLLGRSAKPTAETLAAAHRLRASVRAYLACDPDQRHAHKELLQSLNDAIAPLLLVIHATAHGMKLQAVRSDSLSGLSAIVAELYDASANGTLRRLKLCAAEECRRAFYDRSKPASRRWCQAALCGNRIKTRRYRERHRHDP